jgi:drug/metabolite transporter (DMT)-like permease
MIFFLLAAAATCAGALGTYLTKSISLRMPVWQAVAPLFAINALLAVPLIPFGAPWIIGQPNIFILHTLSIALLCGSTACIFNLITRGRPSAMAVGQAISPASVLIAAPLVLGQAVSPGIPLGVALLMVGALYPLRNSFEGLRSGTTLVILLALGTMIGLLTVTTAALASQGVGLPETYIVRTAGASFIYFLIAPPRALRLTDLPPLAVRSFFVTSSFLLTILAIQRGSVILIQSILATMPLVVLVIEWIRRRVLPERGVLIGALVVAGGLFILLRSVS